MFSISKEFRFSASHRLNYLPEEHPCHRLHGHNYRVRITLEGQLDHNAFVFDYRRLDTFKTWLDETFDHRHLNDVMDVATTAERLAERLFWRAREMYGAIVCEVSVSETDSTWATFKL